MAKGRLNLKRTLWRNPVVTEDATAIEVRERVPGETVAVVLLCLGAIAGTAMLSILFGAMLGWQFILTITVGCLLIIGLAAMLYRPPRVLRLYPLEAVAEQLTLVLGKERASIWVELGDLPLRVVSRRVSDAEKNGGANSFSSVVFAALFGGIAMQLVLMMSTGPESNVRSRVYDVTPDPSVEQGKTPLLLRLHDRKLADHIVKGYLWARNPDLAAETEEAEKQAEEELFDIGW